MTESLRRWAEENHLRLTSKTLEEGVDLVNIVGKTDGVYLHLKPFEGKVIDEDFAFIISEQELAVLESGRVSGIIFSFGGKFYYSGLRKEVNRYNETIYKPEFNDLKYVGEFAEEEIMPYAHLGVHTEYEILSGSGACDLWVKKARFMGVSVLGVCDKNTLASSLSFQSACDGAGIKSVIGETITVARNYDPALENQEVFDLKLFCLNYTGWKNLLLINAAINVDYDKFVPEEFVLSHGRGLVCVIPPESEFNYYIDDKKYCLALLKKYGAAFDEVRYQIDTRDYVSDSAFKKHLHQIDTYILNFHKRLRPITICDSYYLDAEEGALKSMLNKVAGVATLESHSQYFKTVGEIFGSYEEWFDSCEPLMAVIAEGLQEAMDLSQHCDFRIPSGERHLPKFEVSDVEDFFWKEVTKGFNQRFGGCSAAEQKKYLTELEKECAVVVPNGLCDYFMILWDIIGWCHENGIMTGPGRGSVCGSLIAYCLHITEVDPLKYGLMFERFLNETRVSGERAKSADSMPDIDVDFPTEYRDAVKEYIKARYGYAYTCSIGTYTRMKLKTCIKDFGKIKGLSFDYTNKLTKDIDDQIEYTWGDLIEYASRSKMLFKFVQENPEIVHMTKYAMMVPKSESVHPSAVVIVPKQTSDGQPIDIWEWMPVKKIDGVLVSEWEGKYIDKSGFLKEDILGLSQLDKFSSMLAQIKQDTGKTIRLGEIPFDDKEVFRYFKRGWNEDVFQFGTTGLMNYCRQVKPNTIDDLIAMTALFRPGPMDVNAHGDFADIKAGKRKPQYDLGMEDITSDTYSLYVYQEQIMKAVVVGGLSAVESDVLRTTIKKKDHAKLESFGDKFKTNYARLVKNQGIKNPEEYAARVWEKLLAFSGYGFNKSHAAAYTLMSYWSQWLKVNYPLEFWTTALQFSKESEVPYRLAELKKTGIEIEVRPPDVNFSDVNFTCDPKTHRIFFSLQKIKGVGDVAVQNLVACRNEGGQFFSLEEFTSRVPSKVNKTVVKSLIVAGAFDLIENLKSPKERLTLLSDYLKKRGDDLPQEYTIADVNTDAFWILEQKRLTGFGDVDYSTMIADSVRNKRIARLYVNDVEFLATPDGKEVAVAGKLIYYQTKEIKSGTMCTLQIDCNNTIIPILLWPDAYEILTEPVEELKGCTVALSGIVKKDKFKNEKKIYSNTRTRIYVINAHKSKATRYEDWLASKQ